jgi:superfamily I DNA/RNA helicase
MLDGDVFLYRPVPLCLTPPPFVVDSTASLEVAEDGASVRVRTTQAWATRTSLLKCWPRPLTAANPEAEAFLDELHRQMLCHLDVQKLTEPIVVEAVPGAGKTTLLMQIARGQPQLRFLLLTFSRNLAEEAKARCPSNVLVQTLDQICYRRHACLEEECGTLTDERLGKALWPRCQPWQKKRGVHGLGECVEAALSSISPPRFCTYHSETAPYAFAEAQKRSELQSFAGLRRCQYLATEGFAQPTDVDVILVDELQDLERQMLEILWRWSGPMVCVGDRRQQIYGFRGGSLACGCSFDSADTWPHGARQLSLYRSFRLCPTTTALIRSVFNVGISTALVPGVVRRQATWPPGPACVLFRTNAELLIYASKHPEVGIVGRARLLAQFLAAKNTLSSAASWARGDPWRAFLSKCSRESLREFEAMLRDKARDAALSASAVQQIAATAHSSKGSEHARVIVSSTFLELAHSTDAESRNIAFVALSRHRSELVLVECAETPETSKRRREN